MKTSVILHGLHNEFTLDQMKACIELAEKYGGSFRHVVTGIQITGIEKDDKEQFISELPDGGLYEPCRSCYCRCYQG